jgi:hypothetical protein
LELPQEFIRIRTALPSVRVPLAGVAAVGALALAAAVAPGVPKDGRRGPEHLRGQYIVVYRGSVQDPAAQTDKHERGKGSMSGSATAAR